MSQTLNEQLRVCLSAPGDKRRYCKGGIDLKHTRRRVVRLSVTSEMGEGGREAAVSCHIELLTKGFLPYDDRLVKATKLNKGIPMPVSGMCSRGSTGLMRMARSKLRIASSGSPAIL